MGCQAAERVLQNANEAVNRDLLDEALEDLISRVDDWKSHKVESFGKLLQHGVYGVITGKSDQEKDVRPIHAPPPLQPCFASQTVEADYDDTQYEIYLFECILLCCKEAAAPKSKDRKDKGRSSGSKAKNKSAKLQLKGRIFMTNVTDIVSLAKPGKLLCHSPTLELMARLTVVFLFCCRLLQRANLVERRPWHRKFYHQIPQRGDDAEMGNGT